MIRQLLEHPATRGMDLDDPATTELRKEIIRSKPLLERIYKHWYSSIIRCIPDIQGEVLEIGTGAGFLKDFVPGLITSDIMPVKGNDLALNAEQLPFGDESLRAIVLVNVLHHICRPITFFQEAKRCVAQGGQIILVEPWVTPWSRIIYQNLHHEPFEPESKSWSLPVSGPLSGGNDALPWILFDRDVSAFSEISRWQVKSVEKIMPFSYVLSGGIAMRNIVPKLLVSPLMWLEELFSTLFSRYTAMFAVITLAIDKTGK